MKSVFKLSSSRWALLAAFGLAAAGYTPAAAADLGGDCCADLEERVAELEATTARKGNRKVSLTVSGWINEAVTLWDDGNETNAYVGTNKLEQSRVRFVGEAQIAPGYSAGYTLELGIVDHDSTKWNQTGPAAGGASTENLVSVRKSNWWIKSSDLGKVTVGLEGTAMYHVLDDADGSNTRNFSDAQAGAVYQNGFLLRHNGRSIGSSSLSSGLSWGSLLQGIDNGTVGQDGRRNVVRYDSPTIAGFVVTASWGEDDDWGMSLTYANTWGDFKVLGKVGYGEVSDENIGCSTKTVGATGGTQCELFGTAATVMHVPTGLYVYGGYAQNRDGRVADIGAANTDATSSMYFIQGGIEQKWLPLGKTTIFGEYRHDDGGSKDTGAAFNGADPTSTTGTSALQSTSLNFIGAGVVQNIEPAAMDLYVVYRHADGDITNVKNQSLSLDATDMVIVGALMKF
jgi:predicted porin